LTGGTGTKWTDEHGAGVHVEGGSIWVAENLVMRQKLLWVPKNLRTFFTFNRINKGIFCIRRKCEQKSTQFIQPMKGRTMKPTVAVMAGVIVLGTNDFIFEQESLGT
jgi:hypothetical protein